MRSQPNCFEVVLLFCFCFYVVKVVVFNFYFVPVVVLVVNVLCNFTLNADLRPPKMEVEFGWVGR